MVADDRIGTPEFSDALLGLIDNPERREAMRASAKGLAQDQAASALADEVERAAAR